MLATPTSHTSLPARPRRRPVPPEPPLPAGARAGVVAPADGDERIHPFRVAAPIEALADLVVGIHQPWPHPPAGAPGAGSDFERIANRAAVDAVLAYWQYGYDWRANQARVNATPQFTTTIDGAGIHLFHVRSPEPHATPLLLSHGQPGSSLEFLRWFGPLSDPRAHGLDPANAFHVVAPAAPGAPLSGPAAGEPWSAARTAAAWDELMRRLGYDGYRWDRADGRRSELAAVERAAPAADPDAAITAMTLAWLAGPRPAPLDRLAA